MPADDLFPCTTPSMDSATDGTAWVAAMGEVEVALAQAEEDAGLIPEGSAAAIRQAVGSAGLDAGRLGREAALTGPPVVALVAAVGRTDEEARRWMHLGATSQDVVDTAMALVARRADAVLQRDLACVARRLSELARAHAATAVAGRTLLQQAAPMSFGLKAAGWLTGVVTAAAGLDEAVAAFPAQLGGPVGDLAGLGAAGPSVLSRFASLLDLPEPVLPWHAQRFPVARVGAALAGVVGAMAKIAGDVVLLAQTEVAEVAEVGGVGRGASSALPNKRNPVAAVAALAATRRAVPLAQALVATPAHEHERAAGAWQAEAPMLVDLLGLAAVAAARVVECLEGLEVDTVAMQDNLDPSTVAAGLAAALVPELGRSRAHEVVAAALDRARSSGASIRAELLDDPEAVAALGTIGADAVDRLFVASAPAEPTDALIARALALYAVSPLAAGGGAR